MNYIEVEFSITPFEPWSDVLSAELGEIGFESFLEEDGKLKAYVEIDTFDESKLKKVDSFSNENVSISYEFKELEQQNWNQQWEQNFSPVFVDDEICVRATFHEPAPEFKYQIVIDPKMSFGTGHHSTTHLVLSAMREIDFENKSVLDMGSGTGVLAIFAAMKGAKPVYAIDIDEWCSINAKENAERNGVSHIQIYQGSKEQIADKKVDVLLANINRNILLDQMATYSKAINYGGELHVSGFYKSDVDVLVQEAKKNGLKFVKSNSRNDWTTIKFVKV
ncbi:MAG: 50S ribosomal protein L11 methyltransferase [Salibacteraceae bacterium]